MSKLFIKTFRSILCFTKNKLALKTKKLVYTHELIIFNNNLFYNPVSD